MTTTTMYDFFSPELIFRAIENTKYIDEYNMGINDHKG